MNISFDRILMIQAILCVRTVPETTLHYLLRCDFYSVYRLELLNDICALNESLKNFLEENLLKILLYRANDCTS